MLFCNFVFDVVPKNVYFIRQQLHGVTHFSSFSTVESEQLNVSMVQVSMSSHIKNSHRCTSVSINPLSTSPTKWSNTYRLMPMNYLSVFDHFVELAFKGQKAINKTSNLNNEYMNPLLHTGINTNTREGGNESQ